MDNDSSPSICPVCGTENGPGAAFCQGCGRSVAGPGAPLAVPGPPPPPPPQGEFSPDGAWWWNGTQWASVQSATAKPRALAPTPAAEAPGWVAPRRGGGARKVLFGALVVAAVVVPVGLYGVWNSGQAKGPLSGHAYVARPLTGATVEVHEMGADGRPGALLATTTIDEDGYYEVSIKRDSSSFVLLTTSGGSYVDSTSHKSRSAGPDDSLKTVGRTGDEHVSLSPLTTFATARAVWLAGSGNPLDASVEAAFAATARQFNLETITDEDPASADDPKDVQFAGPTSRQLGLILAGLDYEAKALGVTPLGLTDAIADDLGDGTLDGKNGSASVLIDEAVPLPADAITTRLQDAIDKVAASPTNKTHLPAPRIAPVAPEIDLEAAGSLYVSTSILPAWIDGQAGTATIRGSGGTPPYTCELTAGELPKGFSLSSGCAISGGGTAVLGKSTRWVSAPFTVMMRDASQPPRSVSVDLRITIIAKPPTIAVSGGSCPQAGKACSVTVATAKGGIPPYYFTTGSFASGTPPMGMTVNLKGVLTGTPSRAGRYTFSVCVVDLVGASDCGSTTVTVGEASPSPATPAQSLPSGFPANLPAGTYHVSVCTSVAAAGFNTCVDGGDFAVTDGDARALAQELSQVAAEIRSACACSVRYTAFNGREFALVITDPNSGSVTTLRVTKVG